MRPTIIRLGLAVALLAVPALPAWAEASIEIQPAQGNPGDVMKIEGQGFGSGEMIQVDWDGTRIGKVRADEKGAFSLTLAIPADAAPGSHSVKVTGRPSKLTATKSFNVLAPPTTTTTNSTTSTTTTAAMGSAVSSSPSTTTPTSKSGSGSAKQPAATEGSGTNSGSSGGGEVLDEDLADQGEAEGQVAQPEEAGATRLAVGDDRPDRPIALAGIEVTPTTLGMLIVVVLVLGVGLLMLWLYRSPKKDDRRQPASPWA